MMLQDTPPDADDPNLLHVPEQDRLDRLTAMMRRVRELTLDAEEWERRRKAANAELNDLKFRQLPEMFMQAHATSHGLASEGNLPGFQGVLKPYHKAVISAEWPPERQEAGYAALRALGGEDLVRSTVTVEFGRGEDTDALKLCLYLQGEGYEFTRGQSVHWGTLTAWLREQHVKLRREFTREELEAIGATVGHVVEVKQV